MDLNLVREAFPGLLKVVEEPELNAVALTLPVHEVQAIVSALGPREHTLVLTDESWNICHPWTCRPRLQDCEVPKRWSRTLVESFPHPARFDPEKLRMFSDEWRIVLTNLGWIQHLEALSGEFEHMIVPSS